MTDVLIRDVPEDDLRRIDRKAASLGLSRSAYLLRQIAADAERSEEPVIATDFRKFAELGDEDHMRGAWS